MSNVKVLKKMAYFSSVTHWHAVQKTLDFNYLILIIVILFPLQCIDHDLLKET